MSKNEIIKIEHEISINLAKEMEVIQRSCGSIKENELDSHYPDVDSYTRDYFQTFWGLELKERIKSKAKPKKILDIGVGRGESSIYLASLGFEVFCIEPTFAAREIIRHISNKFSLPLKIYQCSAEYLNLIPERNFDMCVFNNSLHHCDDPVKALKNCYEVLRPGGSVFLMNEMFLRYYKSKKNFYKFISSNPVKSGNYGGNEHAYYYYEYTDMLRKSGFLEIKEHIPFRYSHTELVINNLRTILSQRYSKTDQLLRLVYFWCLSKILKSNLIMRATFPLLKYMAFIQITFEGIRE
jgi:ubiquinone/menaquinone biosynthesis C-methylase UbiE